jgi:hypothetical protein
VISGTFFKLVMPGLGPGIHVFVPTSKKDVDGRAFAAPKRLRPRRRVKPGHDEKWCFSDPLTAKG